MKKIVLSLLLLLFILLSACERHAAEEKMYGKWTYHTETTKSNNSVDYLIEVKEDKKTHLITLKTTTKMGSYEQTIDRHYTIQSSTNKQVKMNPKGSTNTLTITVTDTTLVFANQKDVVFKRVTKNN
ncbi:hypothetical protein [Bacillus sp. AFS041924]|uniref:hypothetical protein n=1 Tax=Bacillus sp. AFS041924 TaxID=2033503 RepID=UPI000BFD3FE5|nr:hypothetical protein [Bacillus sp. AFS041924]PGS56007.1 hypothetical protein COC46_01870 [Bacillus sp. AFS041924]